MLVIPNQICEYSGTTYYPGRMYDIPAKIGKKMLKDRKGKQIQGESAADKPRIKTNAPKIENRDPIIEE